MKKMIGAALFAATGLSQPVLAADALPRLALKASTVASAAVDWSGVYIGAHAGYGFGSASWSRPANPVGAFTTSGVSLGGAIYGGQVGIQHQLGHVVLGIEGEWTGSGVRGSDPVYDGFAGIVNHSNKVHSIAAVSGRLGVAFDRFLVFGKVGSAWQDSERHHTLSYVTPVAFFVDFGSRSVQQGWVSGVGLEYAIDGNWSAKIEYDDYRFAARRAVVPGVRNGVPQIDTTIVEKGIQAVKLGFNYRFGWAGMPAPAQQPVGARWTGFHTGAHIGYGSGKTTWADFIYLDGAFAPSYRADGTLGGLQAGFDQQLGRLVIGIAADVSKTDMSGSLSRPSAGFGFTSTSTIRTRIDWLGTVTGRVGMTFDNLLIYGLGGFAWARETQGQAGTFVTPAVTAFDLTGKETRTGYVAGAGVEWMVAPGWSVKAEYNHIFFSENAASVSGPFTDAGLAAGPGTFANSIRQGLDIAKLGFNYHFGAPQAVVARY